MAQLIVLVPSGKTVNFQNCVLSCAVPRKTIQSRRYIWRIVSLVFLSYEQKQICIALHATLCFTKMLDEDVR
jgi:hypothetical protein